MRALIRSLVEPIGPVVSECDTGESAVEALCPSRPCLRVPFAVMLPVHKKPVATDTHPFAHLSAEKTTASHGGR